VYQYQYDKVGNRTEKSVGASTTTYTYNALDQLETETAPGGVINYDYDANGNLKLKSADGQETHYLYDARNKLKQVFNGAILDANLAVEFAYDFSGNRYAKSTRTGQDFEHTRFLIDNNNLTGYSQTLLEYEYYTGAVEKRYEYGDDLYCEATPLPSSPVNGGGDVTNAYFLYDGLGSTRSLTNSDGELTQFYNYHPFGEGIDQPQSLDTNHLFTGEYFDSDLDYYYLRARYYAPSQGRFTGFDPVEDQANKLHKYLYCGNDAVNCVDWSGEKWTLAQTSLVAGIIGLLANIAVYHMVNPAYERTFGGYVAAGISGFLAGFIATYSAPYAGSLGMACGGSSLSAYGLLGLFLTTGSAGFVADVAGEVIGDLVDPNYRFSKDGQDLIISFLLSGTLGAFLPGQHIKGAFTTEQVKYGFIPAFKTNIFKMTSAGKSLYLKAMPMKATSNSLIMTVVSASEDEFEPYIYPDPLTGSIRTDYEELQVSEDYLLLTRDMFPNDTIITISGAR
jgi:RHS repeat-associated protein